MEDPIILLESDNENSGSIAGSNRYDQFLMPVATSESGEGSPYAPQDFPNPGDNWKWKVGKRITATGYMQDRFLFPPKRYKISFNGKPYLASRKAVEEFVKKEFPNTEIDAFWSSFSWKIPAKLHNWRKDGITLSSLHCKAEKAEQSGSDTEFGNCKARNKRCHELQAKSHTLPAIDCDLCCSETGFCRDCCCILCCKTIESSYGGYSFIRCEATVNKNYICGHVAHLECALRSYMAGTVGGSIGLDVEYYCRRCDERTNLIPHVKLLLNTYRSIDSPEDIEKILSLGSCILRGSINYEAKSLQDRIDLALAKLQNGICLDKIREAEDDISALSTGERSHLGKSGPLSGNLDVANIEDPNDLTVHHELNDIQRGSQKPVCITSDHQLEFFKLKDEIDKVLADLKNSQEDEYRIAERMLHAQKDFILGLYQLLETEKSELARRKLSTMDYGAEDLQTDIMNRVNQIKREVLRLKDMKEVAKGFGRVPKRILKEHFDMQIED